MALGVLVMVTFLEVWKPRQAPVYIRGFGVGGFFVFHFGIYSL